MSGPLVEYILRQISPVDSRLSSVKYDIQVSIPGPSGVPSGPYVYRESKTSYVQTSSMYANTTITQTTTVSGPFDYNVSLNFRTAVSADISELYQKATYLAQAYFLNVLTDHQTVRGYTGPSAFTGSGITGSFREG